METEKLADAFGIIDMSNDFVADDGGLTVGKPAQAIIPFIVEKAKEYLAAGKKVLIFMDAHNENDEHFKRWPKHCVIGTNGARLFGDLDVWYKENINNPNLIWVPKENYNGFFMREFISATLKRDGIKQIAFTGVCTDICVFLTVAGADALGFDTVVYDKGCATFTPNHANYLEQMKLCFKTEIR